MPSIQQPYIGGDGDYLRSVQEEVRYAQQQQQQQQQHQCFIEDDNITTTNRDALPCQIMHRLMIVLEL